MSLLTTPPVRPQLKKLRSFLIAGGTNYDELYQHLRLMEPALQLTVQDLRCARPLRAISERRRLVGRAVRALLSVQNLTAKQRDWRSRADSGPALGN